MEDRGLEGRSLLPTLAGHPTERDGLFREHDQVRSPKPTMKTIRPQSPFPGLAVCVVSSAARFWTAGVAAFRAQPGRHGIPLALPLRAAGPSRLVAEAELAVKQITEAIQTRQRVAGEPGNQE